MGSSESIFEKSYQIDTREHSLLYNLLRILEDAAGEHASKLGFGYQQSLEKGFFWVLIRQKLKMNKWPKDGDSITIKTWSKPIAGINAVREFELFADEQKVGECSTTWVILDTRTRRPRKIENTERLFRPRSDYALEIEAEKIRLPSNMQILDTIKVSETDLDRNDHVNNISYAQWILNALNKGFDIQTIQTYEINFLGETFLDDDCEILSDFPVHIDDPTKQIHFRIDRQKDAKVVCTVRLQHSVN